MRRSIPETVQQAVLESSQAKKNLKKAREEYDTNLQLCQTYSMLSYLRLQWAKKGLEEMVVSLNTLLDEAAATEQASLKADDKRDGTTSRVSRGVKKVKTSTVF